MLNLCSQWSSPLLSHDVLETYTQRAQDVAQTLSHNPPLMSHPFSQPPEICVTFQDLTDPLDNELSEECRAELEQLTTDELITADYLEAEEDAPSAELVAPEIDVTMIWEFPVSLHTFL